MKAAHLVAVDTLTQRADRSIEFTRSRAYRKNDQAWVEQKNGAVIRRFLGHERYSGQVAGQTIAHLHGAMRRVFSLAAWDTARATAEPSSTERASRERASRETGRESSVISCTG